MLANFHVVTRISRIASLSDLSYLNLAKRYLGSDLGKNPDLRYARLVSDR